MGAETGSSGGKTVLYRLSQRVGEGIPGDLKTWILRNKESVRSATLTLALVVATAPLRVCHHKMPPTQHSHGQAWFPKGLGR